MRDARNMGAADIDAYLQANERKDLLRFITCGSVDDGKSTLIGRLLYESHLVFEDHLAALKTDSGRFGTQGSELDLALLVDGLAAEREQGITIDVAYRFFSTERRKFIVADTPGHEQYTRNMVTGASTAEAAVILVDARKGVLTQTRRHSFLVSLLGVRRIVLAINKLDAVGYSREVAGRIEAEYRSFALEIGLADVTCIPVSALRGDNITSRSENTPWYDGPPLLEHLESIEVADALEDGPFRMPVQWVNRPDLDFRGFSGLVVGGELAPGDGVRVLPSGQQSTVQRIVTFDGDLDRAVAGQSITVVLADDIDVSRGDVLVSAEAPAQVADQFEAHIVWMDEEALLPGRAYRIKLATTLAKATVAHPKHKVDVDTLEHIATKTLQLNEIGLCEITIDRRIPFDPYLENRDMGGFVLIDPVTNRTVAAGLLRFALRRSQNIHWAKLTVDVEARAALSGHKPAVVWLTGLSGAGKSAIADVVERRLHADGRRTYVLDGDNIRHGLNRDLGFTEADRIENMRRVAEVARLMADAGLIVLVAFISPFKAEREHAREVVGAERFCEVHVDTPLEVAESRDPKGLYRKARAGELPNFTGIDSPYEAPETPEVRIDTTASAVETAADAIVSRLESMGIFTAA